MRFRFLPTGLGINFPLPRGKAPPTSSVSGAFSARVEDEPQALQVSSCCSEYQEHVCGFVLIHDCSFVKDCIVHEGDDAPILAGSSVEESSQSCCFFFYI
ncbi:hypothetical protein GW17_00023399 [Ensete ventricosum]|nr:hypothetical protein GW17_00023399 [Ensete ventricosum]